MQSGYGGVSEIPQFMVESCGGPSLFSITTGNPPVGAPAGAAPPDFKFHSIPQPHPHQHHQSHPHHHQPQPPPPPPPPQHPTPLMPHFTHFHSIPITQQLFQQTHHQFHQLFHPYHHPPPPAPHLEMRRMIPPHHHLGMDQESDPETAASPTQMITGSLGGGRGGASGGGPSFLSAAMNFKLAMNESSGGGSREAINDEDGILQGEDGSESRLHPWQREDESAIKEPSWRPLDIDFINRNNKRCKDKEPAEACTSKYSKKSKEIGEFDDGHGGNNYKPFSELEAIYKPGGSTSCGGGGNGSGPNQTGSGSALTADETPIVHVTATAAAPGLLAAINPIGGSETSAGEEAPVKKFSKSSSRNRRKKRRQQQQQQLSSVASFFENLVKQLMDHQESLHRKFLEVMEKRDQERTSREEAWRKQEASKSSREAAARAQERALAASREAVIIAFLEKITGESLNLPTRPQFSFPDMDPSKEDNTTTNNNNDDNSHLQIVAAADGLNTGGGDGNNDGNSNVVFNSSRWPKAEVQALIRVRSGFESRFQEPGLKGPLWEEVSSTMAALGYQRSAKRCKEKWENINKYFRKTKESGKKRPQHSKTCPYFQQLDQLYSKPLDKKLPASSSSSPPAINITENDQRKDNSELLDAVIESTDHGSLKLSETSSVRFDDLNELGATCAGGIASSVLLDHLHGNEQQLNKVAVSGEVDEDHHGGTGEEEEEEDEDEEGEEGEGESQDHEHQQYQLQHDKEEDDLHESTLYFQRLQS